MKIELTGLTATGYHGVLPDERQNGQPFTVDVELRLPEPAADDLAATVDYSAVAAEITAQIAGPPFALIETLAWRIAENLLAAHPALYGVTVTVHKPQAPMGVAFSDVSCTINCRRGTPFVLSLGANLGDAAATLRAAVAVLAATPGITVSAVSDLYRTTPVEVDDEPQPDYYNLVLTGVTTLRPRQLWRKTTAVEDRFGRERPYPHAPRTLDIDLICVGGITSHSPSLTLPHPRAHQRAFVLLPWAQIAPDDILPQGRVADLAARIDNSGVTRLGPLS